MLKLNDRAIYHFTQRPTFEHVLCGYTSNDNHYLQGIDGEIVKYIRVIEEIGDNEYTQCPGCESIYPMDDKFKKYNILVNFRNEDYVETFVIVAEDELEKLDGVFDD